jgi:peptidoglycan/xylan/chitin deacetylase (PgdA/CDA1 family)
VAARSVAGICASRVLAGVAGGLGVGGRAPIVARTPNPIALRHARAVAAQNVPVLLYHHVRVPPPGSGPAEAALTVLPDAFAEQIALLRTAGWTAVSLAEVMAARSGGPLPAHPVVITFDDGYVDYATEAVPVLRAAGYTSTVYVISGMVGAPDHMDVGLLQSVAHRGAVIGAHTVHHVNMAAASPDVAAREASESRAALQQWTGQSVSDFAYPFGASNRAAESAVAGAGFRDAVIAGGGAVTPASDPYALPRLHVGGASLGAFAASLGIGVPPASDTAWWSRLRVVTERLRSGGEVALAPSSAGGGYGAVRWDGHIDAFGGFPAAGSPEATVLNQPVVGLAATPGAGYWEVASDGGVFGYGDAGFYGSAGAIRLNRPVVGMAATPSGHGYWLVASDGGIFTYGDAGFFGSTGAMRLNRPVVGMAATPSGRGYWLVASDGGIFSFGDAGFLGSTGAMRLNRPVVGMARTSSGRGYWLVASDGGIFSFGEAAFHGSAGALPLVRPVVGMAATPGGGGYWLAASDGGIFTYGDAPFLGSAAG